MTSNETFLDQVDEDARRRFESAWRSGQPRALEEFLPPPDHSHYLGTLVELIQIEMEMFWKAGAGGQAPAGATMPLVEDYLQRFPRLQQAGVPLRLVQEEYRLRQGWGDRPAWDEYRQRFPNLPGMPEEGSASLTSPPVATRGLSHWTGLPDYELLGQLGRGGMGVVYKARQKSLSRVVALKMISAGGLASAEQVDRFRKEAEAVAQLQHPNIVQVYEIGMHEGRPYFTLEMVEGGSLDKQLGGVPQPAVVCARMVETLARAMHVAHLRGIVHRDLKPANVLLQMADFRSQNGQEGVLPGDTANGSQSALCNLQSAIPKVTDFGLAKRLDDGSDQTKSGNILGTPSYMAPEQAAGRISLISAATDVYALGAILYEMLTGRPPFRAETAMDTVLQVLNEDPVPPQRLHSKVPADLQTICLKCLEKAPERRYASALDLAEDLHRFQEHQPILARPAGTGERLWKWARRKPALATLYAVSATAALVLLALGIGFTRRLQEEGDKLAQEVEKTKGALKEKTTALEDLKLSQKKEQEAAQARDLANAARLKEEEQRQEALKLAVRQAQTALYAQTLGLAWKAAQQWELNRARQLLDECQDTLRGWEWHYLYQLCQRSARNLGPGNLVAWDRAGATMAVVQVQEATFRVEVREVRSGQVRLVLKVDGRKINSLALHPDGSQVAFDISGAWDPAAKDFSRNLILICDAVKGTKLFTLEGHTQAITGLAYSPDGTLLASGSEDQTVRLWELEEGKPVGTLKGHKAAVHCLDFRSKDQVLASGDEQGDIILWDTILNVKLQTLAGSPQGVRAVAFSPDGQELASGGQDRIIRLWDLKSAQATRLLIGHQTEVTSLSFDPASKDLASASATGVVKLWNPRTGQESLTLPELKATQVRFSPAGKWLALAGPNVAVLHIAAEREVLTGPVPSTQVKSVAFYPTGGKVAIGYGETRAGKVEMHDAATGTLDFTLGGMYDFPTGLSFHPGGKKLACADYAIHIWDLETRKVVQRWGAHQKAGSKGNVFLRTYDVAYAPDGKRLVSGGADNMVKIWDADSTKELHVLKGHKNSVQAVSVSPDGARLASGSYDQTVRVWGMDGTHQATFKAGGLVSGVAFLPDKRRLAAVTTNGVVTMWDLTTQQELWRVPAKKGAVEGLAVSPDGKRIVIARGTQEKGVRVIDADTGQELIVLPSVMEFPEKIAFSPKEQRLAVVGANLLGKRAGLFALWDAQAAPPAQLSDPVVVDLRENKLRGFQNVHLAIHNQTEQTIVFHYRYLARDGGADVWFPAGNGFEKITLAAKEKKEVLRDGKGIDARRLRFWAETEKGEVVTDHRAKDYSLLPPGADLYVAPAQQTYTLQIVPKKK